jgi:hypothetical protein
VCTQPGAGAGGVFVFLVFAACDFCDACCFQLAAFSVDETNQQKQRLQQYKDAFLHALLPIQIMHCMFAHKERRIDSK